jgi:hypothetical protein
MDCGGLGWVARNQVISINAKNQVISIDAENQVISIYARVCMKQRCQTMYNTQATHQQYLGVMLVLVKVREVGAFVGCLYWQ